MRGRELFGISLITLSCSLGWDPDAHRGASSGASGSEDGGSGASGGTAGSSSGDQLCPPGQFVRAIDASGTITCSAITSDVFDAVHNDCRQYLGERNGCVGCSSPTRYGRVNDAACTVGSSFPDNCAQHVLDGQTVRMFGLNPETGDVDDDDMFYVGFRCTAAAPQEHAGPCAADELVVGANGGAVTCRAVRSAIVDYVAANCALYFGWRSDCVSDCTSPSKWGWAKSDSCASVAGGNGICGSVSLIDENVSLYGLDIDGDADGDTFYMGFHCDGAAATGTTPGPCPAGQFAVGVDGAGTTLCEAVAPAVEKVVQSSCWTYFGWSNDCSGCTNPPTRWGRASHAACVSSGTSCSVATLDKSVQLVGIRPDGDVNDDDKFWIGMKCF